MKIEEVSDKKELKKFIRFPMRMYADNPCYVPPIISFEMSTLLPDKNPAFEHCQAKYWLVIRDKEVVGRIAGIIHEKEFQEKKLARFGWIDFIDDEDVSNLLLDTVSNWAKASGCVGIHGPLGFTDLDFEGALISGFDQMATQATIYNAPYYLDHYARLGFEKAVDWYEVRIHVPNELPKRLNRQASLIKSRFGLKIHKAKKSKDLLPHADHVFKILNNAYRHLYGFYPLSDQQIKYYVKQYFAFIRNEYVSLVFNNQDHLVGMAICFPSLSIAFKKSRGSLFPFGFYHILKAFKSNKHLDLFLIGVDPEYQKLGAHVLIFDDLFETFKKNSVSYVSTGPMLEENRGVLNLWNEVSDYIDPVNIKRRCFIKSI